MTSWGETICDLPKVKHYDMTYVELREAARRGDQKLRVYLNFIVGKFGEEGARQIAATGGTTSQGFDLGAWLLRNCKPDFSEGQGRTCQLEPHWQQSPRLCQSQVDVAVHVMVEWSLARLVAMDLRQMAWAVVLCWIDGSMAGCNL